ncbi:hypothetical protein [Microbacterium sp. WCS2018Hpa-9]|uniref:hypothetical protein n=1 Tax=Microbacterium sp. WCS2018Hpa-9 TaxID=3073635 RepID=UPI002889ABCE|nr:hypothetical protein [Microbacterium sp. WCS2018Hpa-9]
MALDLDALLAKAQEMVENAEPELVPVILAGQQVGVRFLPVSGADWRDLALKHPPRSDVMRDLNVGYNIDALVADYPNVALVDGDSVDDMVREDSEGKKVSKWPAVWGALTATGRKDVSSALWAAHERTPERLVVDAGKASAGSRKKKHS